MRTIYLDNNATTRLNPVVADAMTPWLGDRFAHPSSIHAPGQAARHAIESARQTIGEFIHGAPNAVLFTASGTQADQLAILGALHALPDRRRIVTTTVEHSAVLNLCWLLESTGHEVHRISVDAAGRLDLAALRDALTPDTAVASIMYANNETGVISPVAEAAELTRERGIPLHVDAVQAAGRVHLDAASMNADLLTISAHKFHGPKGVAALWVRPGAPWRHPWSIAASIRDVQSGTENVAGIVGFATAARLAAERIDDMPRIAAQRDRLESALCARFPDAVVIGADARRVANTTTICFPGIEAQAVVIGLSERGVYVSSGAACASGSMEPSHVLTAMGLPTDLVNGAIRFSLSRETTDDDVHSAIERVVEVVAQLRAFAA